MVNNKINNETLNIQDFEIIKNFKFLKDINRFIEYISLSNNKDIFLSNEKLILFVRLRLKQTERKIFDNFLISNNIDITKNNKYLEIEAQVNNFIVFTEKKYMFKETKDLNLLKPSINIKKENENILKLNNIFKFPFWQMMNSQNNVDKYLSKIEQEQSKEIINHFFKILDKNNITNIKDKYKYLFLTLLPKDLHLYFLEHLNFFLINELKDEQVAQKMLIKIIFDIQPLFLIQMFKNKFVSTNTILIETLKELKKQNNTEILNILKTLGQNLIYLNKELLIIYLDIYIHTKSRKSYTNEIDQKYNKFIIETTNYLNFCKSILSTQEMINLKNDMNVKFLDINFSSLLEDRNNNINEIIENTLKRVHSSDLNVAINRYSLNTGYYYLDGITTTLLSAQQRNKVLKEETTKLLNICINEVETTIIDDKTKQNVYINWFSQSFKTNSYCKHLIGKIDINYLKNIMLFSSKTNTLLMLTNLKKLFKFDSTKTEELTFFQNQSNIIHDKIDLNNNDLINETINNVNSNIQNNDISNKVEDSLNQYKLLTNLEKPFFNKFFEFDKFMTERATRTNFFSKICSNQFKDLYQSDTIRKKYIHYIFDSSLSKQTKLNLFFDVVMKEKESNQILIDISELYYLQRTWKFKQYLFNLHSTYKLDKMNINDKNGYKKLLVYLNIPIDNISEQENFLLNNYLGVMNDKKMIDKYFRSIFDDFIKDDIFKKDYQSMMKDKQKITKINNEITKRIYDKTCPIILNLKFDKLQIDGTLKDTILNQKNLQETIQNILKSFNTTENELLI